MFIDELDRLDLVAQPQQRRGLIHLAPAIRAENVETRGVHEGVKCDGVVQRQAHPRRFHGVRGVEGLAHGDRVGPRVHERVVEDLVDE